VFRGSRERESKEKRVISFRVRLLIILLFRCYFSLFFFLFRAAQLRPSALLIYQLSLSLFLKNHHPKNKKQLFFHYVAAAETETSITPAGRVVFSSAAASSFFSPSTPQGTSTAGAGVPESMPTALAATATGTASGPVPPRDLGSAPRSTTSASALQSAPARTNLILPLDEGETLERFVLISRL